MIQDYMYAFRVLNNLLFQVEEFFLFVCQKKKTTPIKTDQLHGKKK